MKLWIGQTISELGSRITREGLPLTAVLVLNAQPFQMGLMTAVGAASALLLMMIFAITDERNQPPGILAPILIGLVVVAIGMAFGGMHGYAINPARDFGPRLLTVVAGFKNNGLTDGGYVFWVPIVGPIVGGLIGGLVYDMGIRRFLSAK